MDHSRPIEQMIIYARMNWVQVNSSKSPEYAVPKSLRFAVSHHLSTKKADFQKHGSRLMSLELSKGLMRPVCFDHICRSEAYEPVRPSRLYEFGHCKLHPAIRRIR